MVGELIMDIDANSINASKGHDEGESLYFKLLVCAFTWTIYWGIFTNKLET
jgi:hypothetical protein